VVCAIPAVQYLFNLLEWQEARYGVDETGEEHKIVRMDINYIMQLKAAEAGKMEN